MSMPHERSWWQRNWKWVVPVGCLTPVVVCGGGFVAVVTLVFGALRASEPCQEAVARANKSAALQAALGSPIKEGFLVSGNMGTRYVNGAETGTAELSVPVSGPKGRGTIRVVGERAGGKWSYRVMEATVEGLAEPIDLLDDKAP